MVVKLSSISISITKQRENNAIESPEMSTENTLDSSEDLENLGNGPLVRMVDVQPIDRSLQNSEEILETCIIDGADYEYIVDDEESNLGSIVSVQSEEVVFDDGTIEFIIPEVEEPTAYLEDPDSDLGQLTQEQRTEDQSPTKAEQESWPTLEILPGGVINLTDKNEINITEDNDGITQPGEMLYACAKCSQSFKYLFSLVKHVKSHQDEEKKKRVVLVKSSPLEKDLLILNQERTEVERDYKKRKLEMYTRPNHQLHLPGTKSQKENQVEIQNEKSAEEVIV